MLREGRGEPLVLFHGLTGGERMWRHVVPLLAARHDTVAPALLGHRGGSPVTERPTLRRRTWWTTLSGCSTGSASRGRTWRATRWGAGWLSSWRGAVARAASAPCRRRVPGRPGSEDHVRSRAKLRRTLRDTRRGRLFLPLLARSKGFRRRAFVNAAQHADRLTPAEVVDAADDVIGCVAAEDLLGTMEQLAPLDPLPCPVTIAWSQRDRILPLDVNGARARELFPAADFVVLPDVGHVPMFDDPRLVADTILARTGARDARGLRGRRGAQLRVDALLELEQRVHHLLVEEGEQLREDRRGDPRRAGPPSSSS